MERDPSDFIRSQQAIGEKVRQYEDLENLDRKQVARWSDIELAGWQAQYPAGSPQHFIAEHEWQRRITVHQVRAAYRAAILSGIMGLAGVALGWWLSEASKRQPNQNAQAQAQPALAQPNSPPKPTPGSPPIQPVIPPKNP